jgi:broad specificity phosphatase PhoE
VANQERKLVLVRHSLPKMIAGLPASQWRLSEEGRRRCGVLAERLAIYDLSIVIASEESKAIETGQILAELLGLPFEIAPGLQEHERGVVLDLGSREEFQAQVARLFEHPAELVFGYETADQAYNRFAAAVARVLELHPDSNLAIVSHGTVMTLFLARANGFEPVPFWKRLGLPAFCVLSLPDYHLLEAVASV